MKPLERTSRAIVLAVSLGIGIASMALGCWALANLFESYRYSDILHDDSSQRFLAWVKWHSAAGTLAPETISRRLLAMPLASRRATADAILRPSFRYDIGDRESERIVTLKAIESGIVDALSIAPSSGDLWLAASRIRTLSAGFDEKAESFLAMSYLMAPREAPVARSRLVFATSVSPLLRRGFAEERARDLETVTATYPEFVLRYRDWFAIRGVELTNGLQRRQSRLEK